MDSPAFSFFAGFGKRKERHFVGIRIEEKKTETIYEKIRIMD